MLIDGKKLCGLIDAWCARYKFVSAPKFREFLAEAEIRTDKEICPVCQTIYLKAAGKCPVCAGKEKNNAR